MPIEADTLVSLAVDFTKAMTSIRGRRVQRLVKREFAGAEYVILLEDDAGAAAILGVSTNGAAFCSTDGTGKYASVFKWLHGSEEALETRFDLLKDSLPILESKFMALADASAMARLHLSAAAVSPHPNPLVSLAIQALT